MNKATTDSLRPQVEVADVFRTYAHKLDSLNLQQKKVINHLIACRTVALGGHAFKCDNCGLLEISYNSCRDRHCPKCQSLAKARWIKDRKDELLPVPYFHIVFTFSNLLYPLTLQNKKLVYNLLFKATSETLKEVALNPDNLGAQIGFLTILHTWCQKLLHHPHIHCIVPGGGLSADKSEWKSSAANFFLSVRILSTVFRAKFLSYLEEAFREQKFVFFDELANLREEENFKGLLKQAACKDWVVYSKRPFAGPEQVLDYLGRYTHRVAISNNRLLSLDEKEVIFQWRDRRNGNKVKNMRIDTVSFMKRFLLHILPAGFTKIRHYGFLGNPCKKTTILLCKELLGQRETTQPKDEEKACTWIELMIELTGVDPSLCSNCQKGHMKVFKEIPKMNSFQLLKLKAG